MMMMRCAMLALILASLSVQSGCAAFSAVSRAGEELDAYTLSPLPATDAGAVGPHLVVALPTAAGALDSDRILVKPTRLQAQYLPDGRWTSPAPVLVQTLLLASFQNVGGYQLVDRDGAGLMPDYTLMTELQHFQAEPTGPSPAPVVVRVGLTLTLIREEDLSIRATRRFTAEATAGSDSTLALVVGFDTALRQVLTEAVSWTGELTH